MTKQSDQKKKHPDWTKILPMSEEDNAKIEAMLFGDNDRYLLTIGAHGRSHPRKGGELAF